MVVCERRAAAPAQILLGNEIDRVLEKVDEGMGHRRVGQYCLSMIGIKLDYTARNVTWLLDQQSMPHRAQKLISYFPQLPKHLSSEFYKPAPYSQVTIAVIEYCRDCPRLRGIRRMRTG